MSYAFHWTGLRRSKGHAVRARAIRFLYFVGEADHITYASYHEHLVTAEVLLDRAVSAWSAGLLPVNLAMTARAEAAFNDRPKRGMFANQTAEYFRWYDVDGHARADPLAFDALVDELVRELGVPCPRTPGTRLMLLTRSTPNLSPSSARGRQHDQSTEFAG